MNTLQGSTIRYASLSDEQKGKVQHDGPAAERYFVATAAPERRPALAERLWHSLGYRAAGLGGGRRAAFGAGCPKAKNLLTDYCDERVL
jgi:hypothetical protein